MNLNDLKDKKIAILGYGIEGKAVADFLNSAGIKFDLLDQKDNPQYLDNIKSYDVLFRSPGIKLTEPKIAEAKASGVAISSQIKFFFDNCPAKIIGVTGTKGKGTTAQLIYEILKAAGISVYLGGNIGNPVLELLGKLSPEDWVVLELSSFQMQDLEKSSHIAVVLMVTSEHLDYHLDTEEYVQAKSAITKFQSAQDFAVINFDYPGSMQIGALGAAKKYFFHTTDSEFNFIDGAVAEKSTGKLSLIQAGVKSDYLDLKDVQLPGFHNVQNISAAVLTARLVAKETRGIDDQVIARAVNDFKGLPHRLELVAERSGIKFYNDSFGTTPETCLVAVQAFSEPEIVIIGGFNKKGEYDDLTEALVQQKNIKAVIAIGQIAPSIEQGLKKNNFSGEILTGAKNMVEVFEQVRGIAVKGDLVLLAPATSSFDWYKNYKERGDHFRNLAQKF